MEWLFHNKARAAAAAGATAVAPDVAARHVAQLVELGFPSHDAMATLSGTGFSFERALVMMLDPNYYSVVGQRG
jgi:hypothetical protein